ncbi:tetratricopeptide repeat protein [Candidatus Cloacimonadota bacterium]
MLHYLLDLKKIIFLLVIISCVIGIFAENTSQSSAGVDYNLQVVKFYFQKQEFDTVLNYITDLEKDTYIPDSLKYFQAMSFSGLKFWEEAVATYSDLLVHSVDLNLCSSVITEFDIVQQNLNISDRIDVISNILNELRTDDLRTRLLFILADVYEEAHFFEEANDVYRTILNESKVKDGFAVDLRIAANYIFLKDYLSALEILEPIISLQDSTLNSDALFLSFNANNSLSRKEEARSNLIALYLNYPEHSKRFEIMNSLAEIYFQEKQYLICWYILEELMLISNDSQLFGIENKIDELRILLSSEEDLPRQFDNMELNFKEN